MLVMKIPTTQRVEESRSNGNYDLPWRCSNVIGPILRIADRI